MGVQTSVPRGPRSLRSARTLCPIGGIPVEYKGGSIPPPDERRAYN